ncbi:MAG TPA: FAD-linked oxidase C-terminal domain-containing protein [Verrucomicrobiae bacterium]|jgi:glycolate oxidase|nr:FAD-linked oxidase C-terminal domain-containing protein [Verrucomicrobiae bacterium]
MSLPAVIDELRKIAGRDAVLDRPEDLMLYEYDAGVRKSTPGAVVFPQNAQQVAQIMRVASAARIPVVGRGAGTGLSGGSIAPQGGIVIAFSRMNRILEVDAENLRAVVQPGVVNLQLSECVSHLGLYFAPDPSSQKACTVGGNVAENSGGPHTLLHGVTVNHVTGVEVVLPSGEIVQFGGKAAESFGYDLTGFFVGSEGTIGIATAITVKLLRNPEQVATLLGIFESIDDAARTVSAITAAGITPAALEMLDGWTLRTVEAFCHAGYPLDAGAVLLIELEGLREAVEEQAVDVNKVCLAQKAREVRRAKSEEERTRLWKGRKLAFAALGRVSPSYYTQDGVVPRSKIPAVLQHIADVAKKHDLVIGNIFHAGDGNLHPLILFDRRDEAQFERVQLASRDILQYCVDVGGSITGEHGVGIEKRDMMPLLFSEEDLDIMIGLRNAFNPDAVLNPDKMLPMPRMCREIGGPSRNPVLAQEGL